MNHPVCTLVRNAIEPGADRMALWRHFDGASVRARQHQTLFHAADPSDAVYLLLEGEARALVGEGSDEQTTLIFFAPAIIGDRDVLAEVGARETVELLVPSRLVSWDRESWLDACHSTEGFRNHMTRDLALRSVASLRLTGLARLPLERRLEILLWDLAGGQRTVVPEIAYLARLLNGAEKTTRRALTALARKQKIRLDDYGELLIAQVLTQKPDTDEVSVIHSLKPWT